MDELLKKSLTSEEAAEIKQDQVLTTIAFGSCNKQDAPQPLWEPILANKPDLWLWLGDNIYGDTHNMQEMKAMYLQQKYQADYQKLYKSIPVLGIWDDHDYGINDGGKNFSKKRESQDLMFDFLDVPQDLPERKTEGTYQSYTIGPEGKQVKFILLDTRYFRDTLTDSSVPGKRYEVDPEGDMLGEAQWQWLENKLNESTAQLHIIASSIQVIAEDHGFEKWANFSSSRERLFQLITSTQAEGVIFLSGDRHIGEISKINIAGVPYPVYDITSSGLTHAYEAADEENRHREGELVATLNFGVLKIKWEPNLQVTASIRGKENQVYQQAELQFP